MNFCNRENFLRTKMMRRIGIFFLLLIFLFQSIKSNAQPANDNCANATPITIGDGGYALGTFTSAQQDMTSATQQTGESFAPSITGRSQGVIQFPT